jgi:hypothetical protein
LWEVPVEQIDGLGGLRTRRYGALEKVGEDEAAFLEVDKDFFLRLCCHGDAKSGQKISGESGERSLWGVEKLGVGFGGGSREQESLNVDGAEARGPFEALKASSDVFGGSELAAAIARQ